MRVSVCACETASVQARACLCACKRACVHPCGRAFVLLRVSLRAIVHVRPCRRSCARVRRWLHAHVSARGGCADQRMRAYMCLDCVCMFACVRASARALVLAGGHLHGRACMRVPVQVPVQVRVLADVRECVRACARVRVYPPPRVCTCADLTQ